MFLCLDMCQLNSLSNFVILIQFERISYDEYLYIDGTPYTLFSTVSR